MIQNISLNMGNAILKLLHFMGGTTLLFRNFLSELRTRPFYFYLVLEQVYQIGVRSLSIVCVTAISTGAVMALQFGFGLEKFGGKLYVPKVVSLSLVRELAPVFTALMLSGRVAAGITAEIGSMKVKQQIDAIRALGTSPIKKIVIPRVLACFIACPILSVIANFVGIGGALWISATELGLDPMFFYEKVVTTCVPADFIVGIAKTYFFAAFISVVGCYYGLTVTGGTQGVGQATTRSVVTSSILILISDFFLTKLFWLAERM